jgi:hypothetical protein
VPITPRSASIIAINFRVQLALTRSRFLIPMPGVIKRFNLRLRILALLILEQYVKDRLELKGGSR